MRKLVLQEIGIPLSKQGIWKHEACVYCKGLEHEVVTLEREVHETAEGNIGRNFSSKVRQMNSLNPNLEVKQVADLNLQVLSTEIICQGCQSCRRPDLCSCVSQHGVRWRDF